MFESYSFQEAFSKFKPTHAILNFEFEIYYSQQWSNVNLRKALLRQKYVFFRMKLKSRNER